MRDNDFHLSRRSLFHWTRNRTRKRELSGKRERSCFGIRIKRPCSHAAEDLEKKNLAARTAVNQRLGPREQASRKLERPVARWVPIGVHSRLRSRFTRCPVAFSYAVVLTRKPASNRLLITSCFLSGHRTFCEIRAAEEMICDLGVFRSGRAAASWCSILPIILGRWHTNGPAIRHRVIPPIQLSFLVLITGSAGDPLVSSIYARLEMLNEGRWFWERISI